MSASRGLKWENQNVQAEKVYLLLNWVVFGLEKERNMPHFFT